MKTLGAFEACIGLQTRSTVGTIYVVQGLSHPLLSRTSMKELGLLHPMFPHHLTLSESADENPPSSGIIQSLVVEVHPLITEPNKVRFGSPQGRTDAKISCVVDGTRVRTRKSKKTRWAEPTCISESDFSDGESEDTPPGSFTSHFQRREAQSRQGHPNPRRSSKTHFSGRFHRAEETRQQSGAKPTPTQGAPATRRP